MKQHNDSRRYLNRDSEADFTALAAELVAGASLESLASLMSLDETRWLYEEATGVLTNKVYADGKGPSYTYTPDGRLAARTWARGITTAYAYNGAGLLLSVDYSDDTPDIAYTYDRLGRQLSAVSSVSTNLFVYSGLDLVSETQNGVAITRATDTLGRAAGFSLDEDYAVSYAYDNLGRFASVTSHSPLATSDFSFTYSYLPGSSLVSGMAAGGGHAGNEGRAAEIRVGEREVASR